MIYILRAGFSIAYLSQELMSFFFLIQLLGHSRKNDSFIFLHLRNVQTPFPHPLQAIHLAMVTTVIKLSIHVACTVILLERKAIRQHELTDRALMRLFVASTYQFWSSVVACFSCLTATFIWRSVFKSTLRDSITCTFNGNCSRSVNIVTPWKAIISLDSEWQSCLTNVTFRGATFGAKFNNILTAFERDRRVTNCVESTYQRNIISTLDNYIINCALCLLANIMHMIYLGAIYGFKRAKANDATFVREDDLPHFESPPRRRNEKLEAPRKLTITRKTVRLTQPEQSSSRSEESFFNQLHNNNTKPRRFADLS